MSDYYSHKERMERFKKYTTMTPQMLTSEVREIARELGDLIGVVNQLIKTSGDITDIVSKLRMDYIDRQKEDALWSLK